MSVFAIHPLYLMAFAFAAVGLYVVMASRNLVKRLLGLGLLQGSASLVFIGLGKVSGGTAPIRLGAHDAAGPALRAQVSPEFAAAYGVDGVVYSSPLPQALVLTAIVVAAATLAVGLAIAVRIREAYQTVEADEVDAMDAAGEIAASEAAMSLRPFGREQARS